MGELFLFAVAFALGVALGMYIQKEIARIR